jgi:hypothetical protein
MPQTSSNYLATIAALEMSNALHNPAPMAPLSNIGTAQLQALRQLSDIFATSLPPTATQNSPHTSQASSQLRNTIHPAPVPMLGSPCMAPPSPASTYIATPCQSPRLAQYPSQRVSPGQSLYPRVAPRVKPRHVESPRVDPTLQQHSVIPLTSHPAAENSPHVPQCMVGGSL